MLGAQLDRVFNDFIAELRAIYLLGFYRHNVPLTRDPYQRVEQWSDRKKSLRRGRTFWKSSFFTD